MIILNNLKYTNSHEWVKVDGNNAYVGLTDYAQIHLGQIVFVDLPEIDSEVKAGDQLAEVESVKAVSEVYSPVSGKVIEINEDLLDNPGNVNEDVYGSWFAVIEMIDTAELDALLGSEEYEKLCDSLNEEEA